MRLRFTTLTLVALTLGCGGPSVGEIISQRVVLTLTAVASDPEVAALGEPAGGVGVTRVFVNASALTLIPCQDNTESLVLPARGYDLQLESPPRESVGTSVTELCGIRLDLAPSEDEVPEGVDPETTLLVSGNDVDADEFALSTDSASSVLLEAVDGAPFGDLPLLLGLDISMLLAGVPLTEDRAEDARALLDAQAAPAFAVFEDANGNQQLDDDETTPVATLAP